MMITLTILWAFQIPSILNGKYFKTTIYNDNFEQCELMRKTFDSISKICFKVRL